MYSMVHRVKFSEGQNITKINNRYHSKEKNIKIITDIHYTVSYGPFTATFQISQFQEFKYS